MEAYVSCVSASARLAGTDARASPHSHHECLISQPSTNSTHARCARAASSPSPSPGSETASDKAFALLDEMRKADLKPELATYNALLGVCAAGMASGGAEKGEEVLG